MLTRLFYIYVQAYFALHKGNTHWVTIVMHTMKKEFQVLDLLGGSGIDGDVEKLVEQLVSVTSTNLLYNRYSL